MTTTSSTTSSSGSAILTALNAGSGIDTSALVTNLVTANYGPKLDAQTAKETANTAKISELATLKNGITSFSSALTTLIQGGTLNSQPTSSDSTILTATTKAGATISSLSAQLEVRQLAQAQTLVSANIPAGAIGQGDMTLTTSTGTYTVTVDAAHDSLSGLAQQINAQNAGVTASVVTDSNGTRLMIKGATGAANTFTLSANAGAAAGLSQFTWDGTTGGMTRAQEAKDAIIRQDGVDVTRSTNTVSDLIDGVTLNLVSAKPGTTVSLGVTHPTDSITQAVGDFVSAYNTLIGELKSATAAAAGSTAAGAFNGNSSIKSMMTQLAKLTSTTLSTSGTVSTLAEIGVSTNRDGTLSLDTTRLSKVMASDPAGVEALFNPTQHSDSPLIKITSAMGTTKPGTYTLANIVAGPPPSGTIDGLNAIVSGTSLSASIVAGAAGLTIQPLGNVASATVTVDQGLGGALKALSDSLSSSNGLLSALSDSLTAETKSLSDARDKLTTQETAYSDQLTAQFTAMNSRVSAYKNIQSYMTQQIANWTKSSS